MTEQCPQPNLSAFISPRALTWLAYGTRYGVGVALVLCASKSRVVGQFE